MKRSKFADICRRSRMREIKREDAAGGVILLADSISAGKHEKIEGLNYRTLWAFGKDEDTLEIAQPIFFKPWFDDNGIWRMITLEERISHAEEKAREWLNGRACNDH